MAFKEKKDTHLVLKIEDIERVCGGEQRQHLQDILESIAINRRKRGKKSTNKYYIVNVDEPYADKVLEVIKQGEIKKEEE